MTMIKDSIPFVNLCSHDTSWWSLS